MVARPKITAEESQTPAPIEAEPSKPASSTIWVPSGSALLDLVLSGGYPLGRIINLVGDRSSGKTLLAIEACANFVASLGKAEHVKYVDAESAFDSGYAAVLGMPSGIQTEPDGMETIEQFFDDLTKFLDRIPNGCPSMYILDSLDALSDASEMTRDIDKGSFGAEKAKKLSQLFRRLVSKIANKNCLLVIVSQIRDKIGVTFGETKTRSGGKALDFYASQIIWLSEINKLKKTALGVERVIGIETRVRTKKNKVGLAFREADMTIIFNYGLDDEASMLNWIKDCKLEAALAPATIASFVADVGKARKARDRKELAKLHHILESVVTAAWFKIEARLEPPMRKYVNQ